MKLAYRDGAFIPFEEATLPLSDALIQRGVGVFDLARSFGPGLVQLTDHMSRLVKSAQQVSICVPWTLEELKALAHYCRSMIDGEALVKIFISGGDHLGEQGFDQPRLFATVEDLQLPDPSVYEQGVRLCPLHRGRTNAQAKTVDYAASFVAARLDPGAFEGLYCPDGLITEAAHSTFFGVKGNCLFTAPDELVLAGTTRSQVLTLAQNLGLEVKMQALTLDYVSQLDEAFITGSVKGVVPVVAIGEQKVGRALPGERTKKIAAHLRAQMAALAE